MNKLKAAFRNIIFCIVIFTAMQMTAMAQVVEIDYDFRAGTLGWSAGFSNYPPATDNGFYELDARIRLMPRKLTHVPRRGFFIQGNNHSDDLVMFLKRRLTREDGIVAGQTYRIQYLITLASNAASGCFGAGGAPGEGVVLFGGASPMEPLAVLQPNGYLLLNTVPSAAGNIANGIPCEQAHPYYPFALIERFHQHTTDVKANANGELWLLVGTRSGFEGLTKLYYQSIRVKLIPLQSLQKTAYRFR